MCQCVAYCEYWHEIRGGFICISKPTQLRGALQHLYHCIVCHAQYLKYCELDLHKPSLACSTVIFPCILWEGHYVCLHAGFCEIDLTPVFLRFPATANISPFKASLLFSYSRVSCKSLNYNYSLESHTCCCWWHLSVKTCVNCCYEDF